MSMKNTPPRSYHGYRKLDHENHKAAFAYEKPSAEIVEDLSAVVRVQITEKQKTGNEESAGIKPALFSSEILRFIHSAKLGWRHPRLLFKQCSEMALVLKAQ